MRWLPISPQRLAWAAVRLKNGNTLITGDNHAYVHEVNPDGKIVWSIETNDLPDMHLHDIQTANRLFTLRYRG